MTKPFVSAIRIYPVKGLSPIVLTKAEIGVHSLLHDREYAMLTEDGRYINGKRTGLVNQLKAEYDLTKGIIRLSEGGVGKVTEFELRKNNQALEKYLTNFFGMKVRIVQSDRGELMDIPQSASVSVVSEASFQSLYQEFKDEPLDHFRLRFRANIEIGGVPAYWEEQLFDREHKGLHFKIGEVRMMVSSPRARCNVPPKDPMTGELDKTFVNRMLKNRAETLAEESHLPFFGNLYHFTIDTLIPESEKGKVIAVGDAVEIIKRNL